MLFATSVFATLAVKISYINQFTKRSKININININKFRDYITWGLTILLAIAFILAGLMKLSGQEMMAQSFQGFGLPDWFRITIGFLEMLGGILLIIPAFSGVSAFGLSIIMIGAVGCHLIYDPITKAMPAFVFFCLLTYIYLARKNVVPKLFQKYIMG